MRNRLCSTLLLLSIILGTLQAPLAWADSPETPVSEVAPDTAEATDLMAGDSLVISAENSVPVTLTPIPAARNGVGAYSGGAPKTLPDLAQIGADVAQIHLNWGHVEKKVCTNTVPQQCSIIYDWSEYDQIIPTLKQQEQTVMLMVGYLPGYLRSSGMQTGHTGSARNLLNSQGTTDPAKFAAFRTFIRAAMTRYKGNIWMWTEESDIDWTHGLTDPTNDGGCYGGAATEFVKLLQEMDAARDAVDPSAKLYIPPIAWEPYVSAPATNGLSHWLYQVGVAGGMDYVDGWAYNYYDYDESGHHWWTVMPDVQVLPIIKKGMFLRNQLPLNKRSLPILVNTTRGHWMWAYSKTTGQLTRTINLTAHSNVWLGKSMAMLLAARFMPQYENLPVSWSTVFFHRYKEDTRTSNDGTETLVSAFGTHLKDSATPSQRWNILYYIDRYIPTRPIGATFISSGNERGFQYTLADGKTPSIFWPASYTDSTAYVRICSGPALTTGCVTLNGFEAAP
jgi:hypothetical protein